MKVKFNIKNYSSEPAAYRAFGEAQDLLRKYKINFYIDIIESDLYVTTEFTGRLVRSRTYSIIFNSEEDYNTFLIIKD